MWVGIVAITFLVLGYLFCTQVESCSLNDHYELTTCRKIDLNSTNIVLILFLIVTITGGLVFTFKDNKPKDEQKQADKSKKLQQKVDRVIVGDIKMNKDELLDILVELLVDTKQARERKTMDEETRVKNIERADKLFDLLCKNNN
jgi:hypothetical protein